MTTSAGRNQDVRASAVALAREAGLEAADLADRIERDDVRSALASELGADTSLLPEDPEPRIVKARQQIAAWEQRNLRLVTVGEPEYPAPLQMVHDRPALLWVAGDLGLVTRPNAVAVVGTRQPSVDGRARATSFASDLVSAGFAVLSGLAAGVDTAAHRAVLQAGGRTLAVIGTGHDHAYPPQNADLQAELARNQAVVSPFWPEDGPSPERFRRRNAVMSGLGLGTVIIEASIRSGTRVQARRALAHGRPVFLHRALLSQNWAAELSRRPGVHVVDSAADVIEVIRNTTDPGPLSDDFTPPRQKS